MYEAVSDDNVEDADNNGEDALDEFLQFSFTSGNDDQFQIHWEMANAGNNWYWAIDNIIVQLETSALGDLNSDDLINVLDVILIVNIILAQDETNDILTFISDINRDGIVNVIDVIQLLNHIIHT